MLLRLDSACRRHVRGRSDFICRVMTECRQIWVGYHQIRSLVLPGVVNVQQRSCGLCLIVNWLHTASLGGLTIQGPLLLSLSVQVMAEFLSRRSVTNGLLPLALMDTLLTLSRKPSSVLEL